jgi:hypothetical protein
MVWCLICAVHVVLLLGGDREVGNCTEAFDSSQWVGMRVARRGKPDPPLYFPSLPAGALRRTLHSGDQPFSRIGHNSAHPPPPPSLTPLGHSYVWRRWISFIASGDQPASDLRVYVARSPRDTLYLLKLALASLTSSDRSIGIVH